MYVVINPLNPAGRFCGFEVPLSDRWKRGIDSHGTSAVFQTVTLFYAVCTIFPSKSFVFDQIKSVFLLRGMVFGRHFVTFAIFSLLRGIYAQKWCFW
jgi:hypothetical protein